MKVDIKVPEVGESVQEAVLAQWFKQDGDFVENEEPLYVIETDKVTLEVPAEASGALSIAVNEGETVKIGAVVGYIDTDKAGEKEKEPPKEEAPPAPKTGAKKEPEQPEKKDTKAPEKAPEPPKKSGETPLLSPSVKALLKEKNIQPDSITGTGPGGRITKGDVLLYIEAQEGGIQPQQASKGSPESYDEEVVVKKQLSPIRQKIATHLLAAKQNTAMLTTFNEIDMGRAMAIRSEFKDAFEKKYNIRLGFMSFFVKAAVDALKMYPDINAFIDKKDIIYHEYYHIGVAVGTDKGLVVPVLKHADKLTFAGTEQAIIDYVKKIKENKLSLKDLEGGTFTITNGGVYGSLMSTPILNMPQSGILGMHKIEDRPVAINGEVVIRPMMYVALSYDHRIVDGKAAVSFLKRIKECIENPERMLLEI